MLSAIQFSILSCLFQSKNVEVKIQVDNEKQVLSFGLKAHAVT
jgi:hypothetical protein